MNEIYASVDTGKPGGDLTAVTWWKRRADGTVLCLESRTYDFDLAMNGLLDNAKLSNYWPILKIPRFMPPAHIARKILRRRRYQRMMARRALD
jgi:hypothetical protein